MKNNKSMECMDTNYFKQVVIIFSLLLLSICAQATGLPDPVIPEGLGINIHSAEKQSLDMIAAAGFKYIRTDFNWRKTERTQGQYDWSAYDDMAAELEKRGLGAVWIFSYSNPLYENATADHADSPQHPESVAAFARWAAAAAQHYKGKKIIWEIWNEPNLRTWKPKPNAEQYATLAAATAKAVRFADPAAIIIAPGAYQFPTKLLDRLFQSGALEQLDGISVHPYRKAAPESAGADYRALRDLIGQYAPKGRKIAVLCGEWGYSAKGLTRELQAAYLVRQQVFNVFQGVPLSIWYEWKDDGSGSEDGFGVVGKNLKPKLAYTAVQTMVNELSGYRAVRRHDVGNGQDFVLAFADGSGHQKLVVWTLGAPHTVSIEMSGDVPAKTAVVSELGHHGELDIHGAQIEIVLSQQPQYVDFGTRP